MDEQRGGSENWIKVAEVPNVSEARIVLALLESRGIRARMEYDPAGSVILGPGAVNPWSNVTIWVADSVAQRALEILDETEDEPGESRDG
ncbi:MAG: putative signal transducing protein [Clostridia bacterium]